jgi:electron transfer flavoprotein beta subunit
MKILFLMSSVPDTTSKINFTDNDTKFDENGIQFVINPHDEFGLTKAMQLKEKSGAELVVLNVGTAKTEPVIRKVLAIGADRAVRIDFDPKDSYSTAVQIADYIQKNNDFDLIIAGKESLDYNGGMVHGLVAAMTGINFVNAVIGLELQDGNTVEVLREIDGGKEQIETSLPLIIGGQKVW